VGVGFQYDVFVSHNQADKPRVRPIAQLLEAMGLRVWLDEWIIKPGDSTRIIDPQGNESNHFGFLVIFNLLELGIEVVRVFEYEVGAEDYFLDGELLVHADGSAELVRMPVGLISHTALKRFLQPASYEPVFTPDQPPSLVGGPAAE
jgi:hypothetical protein